MILFILNSLKLEAKLLLSNLFSFSFMFSDSFSSVESVKAASDAFCPASGKVVEVNTVCSI